MPLRAYLAWRKISIADFAKKMGVSYGHMSKLNQCKIKPSLTLAKLIEKETNGEVTIAELMGEREERL